MFFVLSSVAPKLHMATAADVSLLLVIFHSCTSFFISSNNSDMNKRGIFYHKLWAIYGFLCGMR